MTDLLEIQKNLKAPKNQNNKFGGYKYRSCEDIAEAVKKVLPDNSHLIMSDDVVEVGGRVYVKATATLTIGDKTHIATGYAREAQNRKGFGEDQLTGAASSYARKYALNGLFCIDDTKDNDTEERKNETDARAKSEPPKPKQSTPEEDTRTRLNSVLVKIEKTATPEEMREISVSEEVRKLWDELSEAQKDYYNGKFNTKMSSFQPMAAE